MVGGFKRRKGDATLPLPPLIGYPPISRKLQIPGTSLQGGFGRSIAVSLESFGVNSVAILNSFIRGGRGGVIEFLVGWEEKGGYYNSD